MGQVRLSGGGVRSNVKALRDIPADRLWTYSATVNHVTLCGAGAEADGIALTDVNADEILNKFGDNHSRKTTGVYDDVVIQSNFTAGNEFMSNANGQIVNHTGADQTNRALGKYLTSGLTGDTGRILFYSK